MLMGVWKESYMQKKIVWSGATHACENGNHLVCIIEESVIMCDETIEETKTVPTNFNEKI